MSQIRLARTAEIEQMLEKVKPFFGLNSDSEIVKTLASMGLEMFEKRIINYQKEEQAERDWNTSAVKQMARWAKEENDDQTEWDLSKLKPAPSLSKK